MSESSFKARGWSGLESVLNRSPESSEHFWGIEYYGLAGIGKSRLLNEAIQLCHERGAVCAVFDFAQVPLDCSWPYPVDLLVQLCDRLDQYFSTFRARQCLSRNRSDSDVTGFVWQLAEDLRERPLILLFDSVERCADDLFDWLGKELLSALVAKECSLGTLLAGRGPRVAASGWPKALREKIESRRLDPLNLEATKEHLGHLPPGGAYRASAKEIYVLSSGHPFSTEAVVHWLSTSGIQPLQVASKRETLVRRLHWEVIRQYILADAEDWALPILEVACVARRFDAAALMKLVNAYRPGLAPNQPVQWYIHRINDLLARPLHLIYLDQGGPSYRLDPTFRKLLHTAQAILNPAEMVATHRTMLVLWESWLDDGRIPAAGALQEIIYHTAQITLIDSGDIQKVASAVQDTLDTQLSARFQIARPNDLEQLTLLRNSFVADNELKDVLKPAGIKSLCEQIDAVIRPPTRSVQDFAFTHLVIEYSPPSDYRVSWYKDNDVVVPTEQISSARQFRLLDWRTRPEEIGRAAFRIYLPPRAQEFMRSQRDWAIQLSTDWTDMPWELLHDGTEFLCLSRPIARRPRMLKEPQKHEREPSAPLRALVIGDPQGNLPGAAGEARAVGQLLAEKGVAVDLLVGPEEASANEFSIRLASSKHYDLIHYAGHGYFDENTSRRSGLLFADGAVLAEELERGLNSRAFVFLNTCSSGRSRVTQSTVGFQGRFIEGLATSVLLGGASGCLAPMWDIEDTASQDFVLAFYRGILEGQPLGEAVRRAREAVRDQGPDHWAAWVLYGNPLETLLFLVEAPKTEEISLSRAIQDYREAAFALAQAMEFKQEEPFRDAVGKLLSYLEQHAHLQVEKTDLKIHRIEDGKVSCPCIIAFAPRPSWQLALPERLPLVFPCIDSVDQGHFAQLPSILEQAGATGPLALVFVKDSGRNGGRSARQPQAVIEFQEMQPVDASQNLLDGLRRLVADRVDWMIIGPYDSRTPIRTPEKYFGRQEEINAILTFLGERNHFLVGGRRSGKTSTIYVVQSHLERREIRNLQILSTSLEGVTNYDELREKLVSDTPLRLPEGEISAALLDAIKRYSNECDGTKVILAWDEVDRMIAYDASHDWHLFGALRAETTSFRPTLTLLLAGFPILFRSLHDGSSPFFNFGREIIVRRLRRAESLDLISRPMQAMNLAIDEGLADVVFEYSAGHPSLIQGICDELMQCLLANTHIKADRKTVQEVLDSESVADLYLEVVYNNTSLPPLARLVILLAIELPSFKERAMVEAVRRHCPNVEIALIQESLQLLATYLLARQDQHYRMAMQSFPAVIAKKRDIGLEIEKVVEELRRASR